MCKIRIGIDAYEFNGWCGGIDFITTIAEGISATNKADIYLVIDEKSFTEKIWILIKSIIKSKGNYNAFWQMVSNEFNRNKDLLKTFEICIPNTKLIRYKKTEIAKIYSNREKKLEKQLTNYNIDILLPSYDCRNRNFKIPRIGYIFDFQHKYFQNFFSESDIVYRESVFKRQIENSKYLLVNAQDVKKDIDKYYPYHRCKIFVLPFKPFQRFNVSNIDISRYKLPDKFYIISNQFWIHKSHLTAFEALDIVCNKGIENLHIVCTGKMEDYRNPNYIDSLKKSVSTMKCKENIHFIGYIAKEEQMEIMRQSCGLIQPTLFEGGPGGGSTYNAICLGKTCLLSDIDINKEASIYEKAYYFEKGNPENLAKLMVEHMNDESIPDHVIKKMIHNNRIEYGEFLLKSINEVISNETSIKQTQCKK